MEILVYLVCGVVIIQIIGDLLFASIFDIYQWIDLLETIEKKEPLSITGRKLRWEMIKTKRAWVTARSFDTTMLELEQKEMLKIKRILPWQKILDCEIRLTRFAWFCQLSPEQTIAFIKRRLKEREERDKYRLDLSDSSDPDEKDFD